MTTKLTQPQVRNYDLPDGEMIETTWSIEQDGRLTNATLERIDTSQKSEFFLVIEDATEGGEVVLDGWQTEAGSEIDMARIVALLTA